MDAKSTEFYKRNDENVARLIVGGASQREMFTLIGIIAAVNIRHAHSAERTAEALVSIAQALHKIANPVLSTEARELTPDD